ncbi:hypothetical protein [Limnoglobus roseus]|uniref:Uncharacterized protein n=1 Tax=Limnoglobus roseus TaxID=2598579 RepID=A0A5C1APC2_9BACT|nr:hypothetical protein [Limnoglobus roseus]QEL18718.1 hypothetical protein PX52LOC_05754 [Limnoglobus roseus]
MAQVLVVTNPFGGRAAGERITDPQEMEQILAGEHAGNVVRANHEDAPAVKTTSKTSNQE